MFTVPRSAEEGTVDARRQSNRSKQATGRRPNMMITIVVLC